MFDIYITVLVTLTDKMHAIVDDIFEDSFDLLRDDIGIYTGDYFRRYTPAELHDDLQEKLFKRLGKIIPINVSITDLDDIPTETAGTVHQEDTLFLLGTGGHRPATRQEIAKYGKSKVIECSIEEFTK